MSAPNRLQIHDNFGPLSVFFEYDVWRYVGKLLEILCQMVVIGIAKLYGYGEPVNSRVFFFILKRLVKPADTAVKFGANADSFVEFSLKLAGTQIGLAS